MIGQEPFFGDDDHATSPPRSTKVVSADLFWMLLILEKVEDWMVPELFRAPIRENENLQAIYRTATISLFLLKGLRSCAYLLRIKKGDRKLLRFFCPRLSPLANFPGLPATYKKELIAIADELTVDWARTLINKVQLRAFNELKKIIREREICDDVTSQTLTNLGERTRIGVVTENSVHLAVLAFARQVVENIAVDGFGHWFCNFLIPINQKNNLQLSLIRELDLVERYRIQNNPVKNNSENLEENNLHLSLMRIYTNGVSDERIKNVVEILKNKNLNVNDKLYKINRQIPIPVTASAQHLGEAIGVTKQAILKTPWWIQNRKGIKEIEVDQRRAVHLNRAKSYEPLSKEDNE